MTAAQGWLILRVLVTILPGIIAAVREGRLREAGMDAITNELIRINAERVAQMKAARTDPSQDDKRWQRD